MLNIDLSKNEDKHLKVFSKTKMSIKYKCMLDLLVYVIPLFH